MPWWLWIILGLGLLIAEIATPGGIILVFFGVSAVLLGALVAAGWGGSAAVQWSLFSLLSIASLVTLRGPILRKMKSSERSSEAVDSLIGEPILLLDDIEPGSEGKGELRGTSWIVKNTGTQRLLRGQRSTVKAVSGLKLHVKAGG